MFCCCGGQIGDFISVIDKPPMDESLWWKGKKVISVNDKPPMDESPWWKGKKEYDVSEEVYYVVLELLEVKQDRFSMLSIVVEFLH